MTDKPISVIVFKPADRPHFVAQWTDPETGRKRTKSTGTPNKRDAERFGGKLEKSLNAGDQVQTRRHLWADFRKNVETSMLVTKRPTTQVSYKETLRAVETHVNPLYVTGVNAEAVDTFTAALRAAGVRESTVAKHLRTLKAVLRWGHKRKYLATVPAFDMPKGTKVAGGRAISDAEFTTVLKAVPAVVGKERAAGWSYLLRGLWTSGLRIGEAHLLTWDRPGMPRVLVDRDRPMLVIPGAYQKNGKDSRTPIVPEFLELLRETPEADRTGFVFNPLPAAEKGERPTREAFQTTVTRIGVKSGVRVRDDRESFVSSHDLRRSFCHRWSRRVLPQILRVLARHADVSTTLRYYADSDADLTFDAVWDAVGENPANKIANNSRKRRRK